MQDLEKALNHLADIHAQVSRTEYYRGFNSVPLVLSGVSGLFAASVQASWMNMDNPGLFVLYWSVVASLNVLLFGIKLGLDYRCSHTPFERRKTHAVLLQFMPTLLAGLLLTIVALRWMHPVLLQCMPGLWALLFALGVFACRPFFPGRMFWLGAAYLIAAAWLLTLAPTGQSLSPWNMGLVFGGGQLLAALIIYWEMERHER
ncbi:hypothetical protein [Candidatus Venteria ishoeyi]|uniref:Uncharacterized protein n=2 Tax=Candidatus Venteria ishoeyi TaxID=1899563 RepID=A0A1H6FCF5_9GAMM|nr:hypothetical protein [Candidatus Venteria ishoeyi]MDM8544995.1 hypothetical protein [Candidatus Venteria ishoeyi]SEH07747.1 Uncharacterised protein [Candidatus Venteria ishoeyi]